MLKVKRTTYGPAPNKSEEFTKLRTDIKKEFQKLVDKKNMKGKMLNKYAKLIQSIKKNIKLSLKKMNTLKKNFKNLTRKNSTARK